MGRYRHIATLVGGIALGVALDQALHTYTSVLVLVVALGIAFGAWLYVGDQSGVDVLGDDDG